MDWKKTESTGVYEQWSFLKELAFGNKIRGTIELFKRENKYYVLAKLYETKVIGLNGEEGLKKKIVYRKFTLARYDTAQKKIESLKKELLQKVK